MNFYVEDNRHHYDSIRHHPYEGVEHDETAAYYDFKAHPELIPEALEEFRPYSHYEGVQAFYRLVEWLNGPESVLETNDARFTPIGPNDQFEQFPKNLVCSGGVLLFFRKLELNLIEVDPAEIEEAGVYFPVAENVGWLLGAIDHHVGAVRPELRWGCVAGFTFPTLFVEAPVEGERRLGHEVGVRWWVWGDDEEEVRANLTALVEGLDEALRSVSAKIIELSST